MKKILFAASEAVPFMKTGGLADVTGSLPKYFDKKNYDVRVILPKYVCMEERWKGQLHFLCHFYVNLSWRKQYVGIFETTYDEITYYLVDNEFYFAGNAPYNNIYEDVEKFAFFSKAVLEALPYLDFCPDIIHCHDWQTGLLPVFLRTLYGDEEYYTGIKTVFSIHNLKFQGRWKLPAVMDITGLPEQIFTSDKLESYGEANYLKGGVVYADAVTTVSPTYAYEITTYLIRQKLKNRTVSAIWSESGVDESSIVTLEFEETLASLMTTFAADTDERLVIYGERGRIELPYPHYASEAFLYGEKGELLEHFRDEVTKNGFTYEIEEMIRCVEIGLCESPVVPHSATLSCAELFDEIDATEPE